MNEDSVVNLGQEKFERTIKKMPGPHEGYDLDAAMEYLSTGGVGEVLGFTEMYRDIGHPKVECDTDMAMALCLLALDGLKWRKEEREI